MNRAAIERLLAKPGGEVVALAAIGAGFVALIETLQATSELGRAVVEHRARRRELHSTPLLPPAPLWPCADPLDLVLEVMSDGETPTLVP